MPGALREDALQVHGRSEMAVFYLDGRVGQTRTTWFRFFDRELGKVQRERCILRADARAKYGEVKVVLDQIRLAGIENVALMTEETRHKPTP